MMANKPHATVHHAECFGLRKHKYAWLNDHDISDTDWETIQPQTPFYLFIPVDRSLLSEYESGWKVTDIAPLNGVGMTTARDHAVIGFDQERILANATLFRDSSESDAELCRQLNIPMKKGWDIPRARALIQKEDRLERQIKPVLYRPFDTRNIFYHDSLVWRTVKQVMQHMLAGDNIALSTTRSTEIKRGWEHVFCSADLIQHHTVSIKEVNYLFPLYLYPAGEGLFADSPWPEGEGGRRPNLSKEFVDAFAEAVGLEFVSDGRGDLEATFGPEDVFHYMYAVFHSPAYRQRYAEFLKIDFPRLPLTSDVDLLRTLCGLGERLVKLHLLEDVPQSPVQFPQPGDNEVDKPRYAEPDTAGETGRVYINKTQYFDHVPPEIWEFCVGGYQVCHKWLKDRKGRQLTYDDITHYRHIVAALGATIQRMADIDEAIPDWPIS
jgi:predicted helicase